MKGIDVSKWQGNIDFKAVKKAGIDFVIIRAGYGKVIRQKDPLFEKNYEGAKAAGLHVGAYWFSYANSVQEAKQEAAVCLEAIKGKQFDFPIFYDLENEPQSNYYPFRNSAAHCSSLVTVFCTELEKAGYFAGLYISRSPLQTHIEQKTAERFALWVAEYGPKLNWGGAYGIWQYSSTGRVVGVVGNVDLDTAVVDYPAIIKKGGFNGYPKGTQSGGESGQGTQSGNQEAKYKNYTIIKGDTLSGIAKAYGTTVAELKKINGIKNVNLIYAGDVIKIPVKG